MTVTPSTSPLPAPHSSWATISRTRRIVAAALACLVSAVTWRFNAAWLDGLRDILPQSMTVKSMYYPDFFAAHGAEPILQLSLLATTVLLATYAASRRATLQTTMVSRRTMLLAVAATAFLTALSYGYVADFYDPFSSNARYNWVDYYNGYKTAYLVPILTRWPFLGQPHIYQALVVAVMTVAMGGALRRLLGDRLETLLATALFPFTTYVLTFVSPIEDVIVCFAANAMALWAASAGRPAAVAASFAALMLCRPNYVLIVPAYLAVYNLPTSTQRLWQQPQVRRGLAIGLAIGAIFAAAHVIAGLAGVSSLLSFGVEKPAVQGFLATLTPRPVDGFEFTPFSGAYVLHAAWMLSPFYLAALAYAAVRSSERRYVWFLLAFIGLHLLFFESFRMSNYSTRYLLYIFPFAYLGAVLGFTRWLDDRVKGAWPRLLVLGTLLATCGIGDSNLPRQMARAEAKFPDRLHAARDEFVEKARTSALLVVGLDKYQRNMVVYLCNVPLKRLRAVAAADLATLLADPAQPALVFSDVELADAELKLLERTESVFIYEAHQP